MNDIEHTGPGFVHNGMPFEVRIEEDSVSPAGHRITTFVLTYPRFIHAQMLTHRALSRNAQSSRAMPVAKMLRQPAVIPNTFGRNKPGMQPSTKTVDERARRAVLDLYQVTMDIVRELEQIGVHKQWANRYLEPFRTITAIYTATAREWRAFFDLRTHPDAQEEIQVLANAMLREYGTSEPVQRTVHLPFVRESAERESSEAQKLCSARCARVSYLTFEGLRDVNKDLELYERLRSDRHWSPLEHAAVACPGRWANFEGWRSHRSCVENPSEPWDVEDFAVATAVELGYKDVT